MIPICGLKFLWAAALKTNLIPRLMMRGKFRGGKFKTAARNIHNRNCHKIAHFRLDNKFRMGYSCLGGFTMRRKEHVIYFTDRELISLQRLIRPALDSGTLYGVDKTNLEMIYQRIFDILKTMQ